MYDLLLVVCFVVCFFVFACVCKWGCVVVWFGTFVVVCVCVCVLCFFVWLFVVSAVLLAGLLGCLVVWPVTRLLACLVASQVVCCTCVQGMLCVYDLLGLGDTKDKLGWKILSCIG